MYCFVLGERESRMHQQARRQGGFLATGLRSSIGHQDWNHLYMPRIIPIRFSLHCLIISFQDVYVSNKHKCIVQCVLLYA